MRVLSVIVGSIFSAQVQAQAGRFQAGSGKALSFQDIASWFASLIVVLLIFMLCVWLIRKSRQLSVVSTGRLQVVTGLALGMREKLVLVQVGDKQVLLGVTPGKIEHLLTLEGDEQIKPEATPTTGQFASQLAQFMKRKTP